MSTMIVSFTFFFWITIIIIHYCYYNPLFLNTILFFYFILSLNPQYVSTGALIRLYWGFCSRIHGIKLEFKDVQKIKDYIQSKVAKRLGLLKRVKHLLPVR